MLQFREQVRAELLREKKTLDERKEQMFKNPDVQSWGYSWGPVQDVLLHGNSIRRDKALAFKFMLSEETQRLQQH